MFFFLSTFSTTFLIIWHIRKLERLYLPFLQNLRGIHGALIIFQSFLNRRLVLSVNGVAVLDPNCFKICNENKKRNKSGTDYWPIWKCFRWCTYNTGKWWCSQVVLLQVSLTGCWGAGAIIAEEISVFDLISFFWTYKYNYNKKKSEKKRIIVKQNKKHINNKIKIPYFSIRKKKNRFTSTKVFVISRLTNNQNICHSNYNAGQIQYHQWLSQGCFQFHQKILLE